MSIFKFEAQGEANSYRIKRDDHWFAIVQLNGELYDQQQIQAMEKIVDALNVRQT